MVPLLGLWCPRPQGEGYDPCDPLDPPLGLKKFWQDLAWSAEPDRGGKGSVKECRARLGMDWRCTGAGQGRAGEDLVGPERSRIGLPTEPREPRQAQASAKDRSWCMWYT